MTDEEILDRISAMLASPDVEVDAIRCFIRDQRQVGWKRRFQDTDSWMQQHGHVVEELKRPKFGKAKGKT